MRAAWILLVIAACGRGEPSPCRAWKPPAWHGRIGPAALSEASGIVVSRHDPGVLWVLQDSGHTPTLFALRHDGSLRARVELQATNTDWEALAIGPCPSGTCLFVGDTGDNLAERPFVTLWVLPEPLVDGTWSERTVSADEVRLRYPDRAQDAEALVVTPAGTPVILTKRGDGVTRLFAAPSWQAGAAVSEMEDWGALDVSRGPSGGLPAAATDASLSRDGSRLLVRTYLGAWEFLLSDGSMRNASRAAVPFALEIQGEAIAWDEERDAFWQVPEGEHSPIAFVQCARRD